MTQGDKRYGTKRWQRVRLRVLQRDLWTCYVKGCGRIVGRAHCDHISAVYPGMPDAEFYAESNLRASCQRHNVARGVAARLEREVSEGVSQAQPSATPFGRSGRFLRERSKLDRPLDNLSPLDSLSGDYTARRGRRTA